MEPIGDTADHALSWLSGLGTSDGGHRDMGFVLKFPICQSPPVVLIDRAEERLFRCCAADDLATDESAGLNQSV